MCWLPNTAYRIVGTFLHWGRKKFDQQNPVVKLRLQCFFLQFKCHIIQMHLQYIDSRTTFANSACYTLMYGLRGLERMLLVILKFSLKVMPLQQISRAGQQKLSRESEFNFELYSKDFYWTCTLCVIFECAEEHRTVISIRSWPVLLPCQKI